jgi:hypothetical protein
MIPVAVAFLPFVMLTDLLDSLDENKSGLLSSNNNLKEEDQGLKGIGFYENIYLKMKKEDFSLSQLSEDVDTSLLIFQSYLHPFSLDLFLERKKPVVLRSFSDLTSSSNFNFSPTPIIVLLPSESGFFLYFCIIFFIPIFQAAICSFTLDVFPSVVIPAFQFNSVNSEITDDKNNNFCDFVSSYYSNFISYPQIQNNHYYPSSSTFQNIMSKYLQKPVGKLRITIKVALKNKAKSSFLYNNLTQLFQNSISNVNTSSTLNSTFQLPLLKESSIMLNNTILSSSLAIASTPHSSKENLLTKTKNNSLKVFSSYYSSTIASSFDFSLSIDMYNKIEVLRKTSYYFIFVKL